MNLRIYIRLQKPKELIPILLPCDLFRGTLRLHMEPTAQTSQKKTGNINPIPIINSSGKIHVQKYTLKKMTFSSWWLNQPLWKILVKLDHLPKDRGENFKNLWVATTQFFNRGIIVRLVRSFKFQM